MYLKNIIFQSYFKNTLKILIFIGALSAYQNCSPNSSSYRNEQSSIVSINETLASQEEQSSNGSSSPVEGSSSENVENGDTTGETQVNGSPNDESQVSTNNETVSINDSNGCVLNMNIRVEQFCELRPLLDSFVNSLPDGANITIEISRDSDYIGTAIHLVDYMKFTNKLTLTKSQFFAFSSVKKGIYILENAQANRYFFLKISTNDSRFSNVYVKVLISNL